ncbi:MAG: hypothetical protein K5746_10060 [Clostridiales bacterium]|nr:hypothetical protein [Clostridiales bacterium]
MCILHPRILPLLALLLLLSSMGCFAEAEEETPALSYEVKFLLDSDKVLGETHLLTSEVREIIGLDNKADYQAFEVFYLETEDWDFLNAGWINRIRWRAKKKYDLRERTYKKRYSVPGNNLDIALAQAEADGFKVGNDYEAQIDWGYSNLTLSFSKTIEEELPVNSGGLSGMSTGKAQSYAAEAMPEEVDAELIAKAQKVGLIRYSRIKGKWQDGNEETEVTVEIWPIHMQGKTTYITELSFKVKEDTQGDIHSLAKAKRERMTTLLNEKDILLSKDSLKTNQIMEAYLRKRPEKVSFTLPTSLKTIGKNAFAGTAAASVWIPGGTDQIAGDPFTAEDKPETTEANTFLVIGTPGSGADDYATEYGYSFIPE